MSLPRSASLTRSERLDGLPFTREHRKLLVGSGTGWALDAMDVGLISFVLVALADQWGTSSGQLSWIVSAGFLGMSVGAALGGLLADRFGRRSVFALTLLVYGLATGASALAASVAALVALRFVVGLGLGAELPVASTLVSEYAPARIRGRVVVALEAFWAVGWTLAAVIGYLVVPAGDDGWRWALALGAVPAVYAAVVRFGLPESVRFLESKGRDGEAEAAVQRFERSALRVGKVPGVPHPDAEAPASVDPELSAPGDAGSPVHQGSEPSAQPGTGTGALSVLWGAELRRRTAALWLVWFCVTFSYYGAFIWLPSLLVADGFTIVRSFEYTLIITLAQLPGYAASAYLVERWGRRSTLSSFLAGSAMAAGLLALAEGPVQIVLAGCLLSFFNLGAWGALYAVTPELYPTRIRATGAGWAAGFGRIASVLGPLAVPLLNEAAGSWLVFTVVALVFVVAVAGALVLPEQRGRPLDAR